MSVKFYRETFVHDALGPESNYDQYYWMFKTNQDRSIEYLVYDSVGDKKATLHPTSSDSKEQTSALTSVNLPSGSYTLIAKLGSQILAQGRFTVAK